MKRLLALTLLALVASSAVAQTTTISALPAGGALGGTEAIPMDQTACASPATCKTTPAAITTYVNGNASLNASKITAGSLTVPRGGTGVATITGVIKGNGASAVSAAASADVISLWSGTCSSGTFLRGDGACAAAGGSTAAPGTIPDLLFWFESDNILASSGAPMLVLQNRTPWSSTGVGALATSTGATISSTQLNSLNVVTFPGSAVARYTWSLGLPILHNSTIFVAVKPASFATISEIVAGAMGALELRISTAGQFVLVNSGNSAIGTCTATMSTGTWYQANVTYNDTTGAFAFRQAQASGGSGTNIAAVSVATTTLGYYPSVGLDLNADIAALIIYNRVLNNTEITTVETYLNAKWGI